MTCKPTLVCKQRDTIIPVVITVTHVNVTVIELIIAEIITMICKEDGLLGVVFGFVGRIFMYGIINAFYGAYKHNFYALLSLSMKCLRLSFGFFPQNVANSGTCLVRIMRYTRKTFHFSKQCFESSIVLFSFIRNSRKVRALIWRLNLVLFVSLWYRSSNLLHNEFQVVIDDLQSVS